MKGRFPDILNNPTTGEAARRLYDDAQEMLDRVVAERWLTARGVYGLFPANAEGDDVVVFTDDERSERRAVLHQLRQQGEHRAGVPHRALSDYVAPLSTGLPDHVGGFAVTAGIGLGERVRAYQAENDDYSAILLEALADRLAEAFAERLHQRVRTEFWGHADDAGLSAEDLSPSATRASGPPPATPPAPTTPRSRPCGTCSTWRSRWGSRSPSRWRCGRARRSPGSTTATPSRSTSSSGASVATRSPTTPSGRAGASPRPRSGCRRTWATTPMTERARRIGGEGRRLVPNDTFSAPDVVVGDQTASFPAAVLWDMDGTLVDTEPYWIETEHDLAAEHGAPWTHEDAMKLVGNDLLDSGAYIRERMGLDLTPAQIVELLLDSVVEKVRRAVPWRPGARELLEDLGAAGVRCALVTMSWRRFVEPVLEQLPAGAFEVVVTGDEVAHGKPHPEPYLHAARLLGVQPGGCVALEDSPPGAASAAAAGCRVLVVPHHVPVGDGERLTFRESLSGLSAGSLAGLVR